MSKNKDAGRTGQEQESTEQAAKKQPKRQSAAPDPETTSAMAAQPAEVAKAKVAKAKVAKAKVAKPKTAESSSTRDRGASHPKPEPAKTSRIAEVPRPAGDTTPPQSPPTAPRPWLIGQLQTTLEQGEKEVAGIRRRLQITYWSMIILTTGLFVFGVALVGLPARAYYNGNIEEVAFGALAAAGVAIIGLVLYFRPLERLQTMQADATYVSLIKDSFQYQVTLRMLALDIDDAKTVAEAASHVSEAAQASMDLVYTQLQARRAAGG